MTLLYYGERFLQHDTGRHPECAERLRQIVGRLSGTEDWQACQRLEVPAASLDDLRRVHDAVYIAAIQQYAQAGGGLM